MACAINLRQVELFKAVIEHGTVSRAAEVLAISQPAASKLLMQLEADHGLKLFDRGKGRLVPTAQAMRLHKEIGRWSSTAFVDGLRYAERFLLGLDRGTVAEGRTTGVGCRIPPQHYIAAILCRNPMSEVLDNLSVPDVAFCWDKALGVAAT